MVRSSLDSAQVSRALEEQAAALDKNTPVYDEATMEQRISVSLSKGRFIAALVGGFCGLAMLLGVYGNIWSDVLCGIATIERNWGSDGDWSAIQPDFADDISGRDSHGPSWRRVGLAGAIVLGRFLKSQLFEVSLTDPVTYLLVGLVLATAAFWACAIPALRATRVDPMVALRYE